MLSLIHQAIMVAQFLILARDLPWHGITTEVYMEYLLAYLRSIFSQMFRLNITFNACIDMRQEQ
jgi:hypothetical protein